jgi:hypothetical protein
MTFDNLHNIAQDSLNSCLTPLGYSAGNHHFVDIWARDAFFASLGDLTGNGCLSTLKTFKSFQRNDGLIPYRVRRSSLNLMKYFGNPTMLKQPIADFRSFQSGRTVYDGGILYILIFSLRVLESGNSEEVLYFANSISKAFRYYKNRFGNGLIKEGFQSEWVDQVLKSGNVLYTNVIYLAALKNLIEVVKRFPDEFKEIDIEVLKTTYESLLDELNRKLWNGKYFSDFYNFKRQDYLASFPNLLAIIFGIARPNQTESILESVEKYNVKELGVTSNYPKYPWYLIPIQNYVLGLRDYHNGLFWLQPWLAYIYVLKQIGKVESARKEMEKLSGIILRDKVVSENYDISWVPTSRRMYKSEAPFAWNSGMILWVLKMLK